MTQYSRGTAAPRRRHNLITVMLATAVVAAGLVAAVFGVQAGAGAAAPTGTLSVYGSPAVAGSSLTVTGTGCISTTGAAAVLVSLNTPSGTSIAGTVVTPYPASEGAYAGYWYTALSIPFSAAPSTSYTVSASCRGQGQIFAYAPATVAVTASTAHALTVSPEALTPGSSTTVSGSNCLLPAGSTQPISVQVTLVNDESVPVDVAAVVPNADGTWSASLTVPAGSAPGVDLVAANCDLYTAGVDYQAQSISIQMPLVGPATTVTTYRGATSAPADTQVTLAAAVRSAGGPVAGVPVTLSLGASTVVATTNTNGVARGLITSPGSGSTTVSAMFSGTSGFAPSASGSVPFTVSGSQSVTKLAYTGATKADQYSPTSLSAKLTGPGGVAVVGRAVTFSSPGNPLQSAFTNASGVATVATPLAETGANTIKVIYNGNSDPTYGSSVKSATVTVGPPFVPAAVACASASKCTVVGSNGESRYSANGGQSWTSVAAVASSALNSVACPTATRCVAVGASGTVVTSSNAGASWTAQPAITAQSLSVVKCDSATACVAVGAAGVVFTSTTAGASWSAGASGTSLNFDALACPTTTKCLATANGAGSATLVSSTSGSTWSTVSGSEPGGAVAAQDQFVCSSATNCLSSSPNGGDYLTVNGGQTWTPTGSAFGSSFSCKSKDCLSFSEFGYLGTSVNSGATWSYTFPFNFYGTPQDLTCVAKQCVGLVLSPSGDSSTYVSADGGVTWSQQTPL